VVSQAEEVQAEGLVVAEEAVGSKDNGQR